MFVFYPPAWILAKLLGYPAFARHWKKALIGEKLTPADFGGYLYGNKLERVAMFEKFLLPFSLMYLFVVFMAIIGISTIFT